MYRDSNGHRDVPALFLSFRSRPVSPSASRRCDAVCCILRKFFFSPRRAGESAVALVIRPGFFFASFLLFLSSFIPFLSPPLLRSLCFFSFSGSLVRNKIFLFLNRQRSYHESEQRGENKYCSPFPSTRVNGSRERILRLDFISLRILLPFVFLFSLPAPIYRPGSPFFPPL